MVAIIRKVRQALLRRDIIFYFREIYLRKLGAIQIFILQKLYGGRLSVSTLQHLGHHSLFD